MTRAGFSESFLLAGKGIFEGIAKDRNTKIHLFVGLAVIIVSLLLKISRVEFLIIGIICFLVIVLELFNNCMERIIDVIFPYYNKELGKVKDIFAGIVLSA
ncbi:MAG: diacylglycerol kinase family protein, partial [Nanoarchaeota archaeon]